MWPTNRVRVDVDVDVDVDACAACFLSVVLAPSFKLPSVFWCCVREKQRRERERENRTGDGCVTAHTIPKQNLLFRNKNSPSAATMKSKKLTSPTFEAGLFGCTPSTRYPHFPTLSPPPCVFPITPPRRLPASVLVFTAGVSLALPTRQPVGRNTTGNSSKTKHHCLSLPLYAPKQSLCNPCPYRGRGFVILVPTTRPRALRES